MQGDWNGMAEDKSQEIERLRARVEELEGAIKNALNAPNHIESDSILFEAIKP